MLETWISGGQKAQQERLVYLCLSIAFLNCDKSLPEMSVDGMSMLLKSPIPEGCCFQLSEWFLLSGIINSCRMAPIWQWPSWTIISQSTCPPYNKHSLLNFTIDNLSSRNWAPLHPLEDWWRRAPCLFAFSESWSCFVAPLPRSNAELIVGRCDKHCEPRYSICLHCLSFQP